MSLHRFLAYTVLACWIAITAVVVGTALQWSSARAGSEIKIERAREAQREADSNPGGTVQQYPVDTAEERNAVAEIQRNHDRLVLNAEAASEEMGEAIHLEQIEQKHFWVEFAIWGGLTLLGSALLAERHHSEEVRVTQKDLTER